MPETQRTRREFLASIFQPGQVQGIDSQDMRDLVASSVGLDKNEAVSLYCFNQAIPVPHNVIVQLPFDVTNALYSGTIGNERTLIDPNDYTTSGGDDPEPYTGKLGGFYLTGLPKDSVWCCQTNVSFDTGTFADADKVQVVTGYPLPDYEFPEDASQDTAAGIFANPNYAYGAVRTESFAGMMFGALWSGIMTFPLYDDDRFDSWNFGSGYVYQRSGETQMLNGLELDIWRIR